MQGGRETKLEERSRALFEDSVESLPAHLRSRLTQARHAALEAAARRPARALGSRWRFAVGGLATAAVLAIALWFAWPAAMPPAGSADGRPNIEDLDIVASSDPGSVDALDLAQDDVEFYAWAAERAGKPDSGHAG